MVVRLVEAKDGVMQLVVPLRELPLVQVHALNAQPFKRLARLADADGAMPTARIRSLATQLGVGLPDDNDSSETERAKWVWQLAVLERSITARALGYLKAAQADGRRRRQVGRDGGRVGRHRSFHCTVDGGRARGEARGDDGGGGGGGGCRARI